MKKGITSVIPTRNKSSRSIEDTTSLFGLSCQIYLFMLAFKIPKTCLGRIRYFIFSRAASVLDLGNL